MTISTVKVDNWQAPGAHWWQEVQSRPGEQLIEATISMRLSFDEYCRLLSLKGSQPESVHGN